MVAETVTIRQMSESDLEEADKIMRLAFGTFLGIPTNVRFMGDADYIKTRYNADPSAALVAESSDGRILGSNFATNWGTVAIFGPLTVHPDYWEKGIARQLMQETMKIFHRWNSRHLGLFTFAQSGKHIHLYQKFNFWPRFLTAIMAIELDGKQSKDRTQMSDARFGMYSQLSASEKEKTIAECANLTGAIYRGLNLENEINSVDRQQLGDTLFLRNKTSELVSFAVCHTGAGSEAGSGTCYIKFGAARFSDDSKELFNELLDSCMNFGSSRGASKLVAGVNMARHSAYKVLLDRGFKTELQGVTMDSPNEPGYNLPNVHIIDDWR